MGLPRDKVDETVDWVDPEYFYAVTDGFVGNIYPALYERKSSAAECAKSIGGSVVMVQVRIAADYDGDYVEPKP